MKKPIDAFSSSLNDVSHSINGLVKFLGRLIYVCLFKGHKNIFQFHLTIVCVVTKFLTFIYAYSKIFISFNLFIADRRFNSQKSLSLHNSTESYIKLYLTITIFYTMYLDKLVTIMEKKII